MKTRERVRSLIKNVRRRDQRKFGEDIGTDNGQKIFITVGKI